MAQRLNQQPSSLWQAPQRPVCHRNPAPPHTWSNREAQHGSSRRKNRGECGGLLGIDSQEIMCGECWETAAEMQCLWKVTEQ